MPFASDFKNGFDLYLYSASNGIELDTEGVSFTIGSTTLYTKGGGTWPPASFIQGGTTFGTTATGANYVKFSNLQSSSLAAGDILNVTMARMQTSGQNIVLNGLQIVAVPEPTTWALLAGSLTALVIFRRRRRC